MPYSREEVGHTNDPDEPKSKNNFNIVPLKEPSFSELLEEVQRATHDGVFDKKLEVREFHNTQFVCWLNDFKQNRKGDLVISLMIPYRWRVFGFPLADAQGIPLSVDIVRWKKYDEYRESLARDAEDGGGAFKMRGGQA